MLEDANCKDFRPLISLIVPVYNDEKRIGGEMNTLARFLDQKSSSWEIILVDDGSKDGTWSEILKLVRSWKREMRGIRMDSNQGKED